MSETRCSCCGQKIAIAPDNILHVDISQRLVKKDDDVVKLTNQQMDVFVAILRVAPRVISRIQIMGAIYKIEQDEPFMKMIDVRVSQLRKVLSCLGVSIKTSWAEGYFIEHDGPVKIIEKLSDEEAGVL